VVTCTGPSNRPSLEAFQLPEYMIRLSSCDAVTARSAPPVRKITGIAQALYTPEGTSPNGQPDVNMMT